MGKGLQVRTQKFSDDIHDPYNVALHVVCSGVRDVPIRITGTVAFFSVASCG